MAAEDEQFTHILGDYLVKVSAFTIVIDSSYLLWTSTSVLGPQINVTADL